MITTLLLTAGLALAQPAASPTPPVPPAKATMPDQAARHHTGPSETLVTLTFAGGTLDALAAELRTLTTPPASIVVAPSLANLEVSRLSVADVTVENALRAAIVAATPSRAAIVTTTRGPLGSTLFAVEPNESDARFVEPPDQRSFQVFSIERAGVEPEVALSAIKAALDLLGDPRDAKISFHKDSSLIMLQGSVRQTSTVSLVLVTLEQANASRANASAAKSAGAVLKALDISSPEAAPQRIAEIQAQLKSLDPLRAETATLRAELDAARARIKDCEGRAGAILAENEKLHELQRAASLEVERTRLQLQNAQREIERLTITNAELRKFVDDFRKTPDSKEPR